MFIEIKTEHTSIAKIPLTNAVKSSISDVSGSPYTWIPHSKGKERNLKSTMETIVVGMKNFQNYLIETPVTSNK